MDRPEATTAADETEEDAMTTLGSYNAAVHPVEDAAEEILLLWSVQQPTSRRQNSFVRQSSPTLHLDACGHHVTILQSPSSMSSPGVTGAVMWDSGIVLAKFLEHAVDSRTLSLNGKRVLELGSGCGLVGCVAALLGAHVVLTDLPDRMRLLKKNVERNVAGWSARGSATVAELTWGDDLDSELAEADFDFVVGSDVIYSEGAVVDLLCTLRRLSRSGATTIFLAGELRNDEVLHCFLEAALEEFLVGRIDQMQWHPNYHSDRVAVFVLVKRAEEDVGV